MSNAHEWPLVGSENWDTSPIVAVVTHAKAEVHHVFSNTTPHFGGLGHLLLNTHIRRFCLRSLVTQKKFQTKCAASVVARVSSGLLVGGGAITVFNF